MDGWIDRLMRRGGVVHEREAHVYEAVGQLGVVLVLVTQTNVFWVKIGWIGKVNSRQDKAKSRQRVKFDILSFFLSFFLRS